MGKLGKIVLEKLKEAWEKHGTQTAVANIIEMKQGDINQLLNQKRSTENITLAKFEKMLPILNGIDLYIDGQNITTTQNSPKHTTHGPNSPINAIQGNHNTLLTHDSNTHKQLNELLSEIMAQPQFTPEIKVKLYQMIETKLNQE